MNFLEAIKSGFKNYCGWKGRASRSEYWYWFLFVVLGGTVASMLDVAFFFHPAIEAPPIQPISGIFNLLTLLPSIFIGVRRLHDVDRSGWWTFIGLTVIGLLFPLLYWYCKPGTKGPNRFGEEEA